jgi:hypothetical protein
MARSMTDRGEAFRAVLVRTSTRSDGTTSTRTEYEGPYATVGAAKARVTYWTTRDYRREQTTGYVEKAATNWERVDGPPGEEMVTVPLSTLEFLKEDSRFLSNLQAAGVDNWEGYEYAFSDEGVDG